MGRIGLLGGVGKAAAVDCDGSSAASKRRIALRVAVADRWVVAPVGVFDTELSGGFLLEEGV